MEVSMHQPKVKEVQTYRAAFEFHVVQFTDGDGVFNLFINENWSEWDSIVKSVEKYRLERAAARLGVSKQ